MTRSCIAVLAFLLFLPGPSSGQTPQGCYFFDRPLGHSASGNLERHDSAWSFLQLRDSGVVARPRLSKRHQEMFSRRSSWRASGDSLLILTSTGLVGWNITLFPAAEGFAGRALYLTDVVVRGAEPLYVPVRARRVGCGPPA